MSTAYTVECFSLEQFLAIDVSWMEKRYECGFYDGDAACLCKTCGEKELAKGEKYIRDQYYNGLSYCTFEGGDSCGYSCSICNAWIEVPYCNVCIRHERDTPGIYLIPSVDGTAEICGECWDTADINVIEDRFGEPDPTHLRWYEEHKAEGGTP